MAREKREIRQKIARQRQRIERRVEAVGAGLSSLWGWSKQVERRPAATLLTAFGGGLAAGLGGGRSANGSGSLVRRIVRIVRWGRRLWREFQNVRSADHD